MYEIFQKYQKAIITGGGVLIFLLAGLITMFVVPSENVSNTPQTSVSKTGTQSPSQPPQNQNVTPEAKVQSKILYVYVTGEVRNPGVYKLSEDARIFQAVEAAGGLSPNADAEAINMAETLADGVHVHIGAKSQAFDGQSPRIPGMPAGRAVMQSGYVDINSASASELEALPGIGPAIAKRIIDYRNTHGNFASPEDIAKVRGIGRKTMENIRPHITAMNSGAASGVIYSSGQVQGSTGGKIDINSANAKELEKLNGVGAAIAKRIVAYRKEHGRFTRAEDLLNVRGIGQSKLEKMRGQIVIR